MAFKRCELLAPAGGIAALRAAVYAGADAVYFGGGGFNARAFAENFDEEEMDKAFEICRLFGVKAYITLNTLVTDAEMSKALDFVSSLEDRYKPDAYIVQDVGLAAALRANFPGAALHASTQMQLHSSLAAQAAKKLGISRIVFARELSRDNIKAAAACGLETEVFVHGAVCVCQSGGCLMSSFIGGRSGNRGRCAQPCRQSYNGAYPLSLKDLCYAEHIPELCDMGIDSLKIEGRMKTPEYVYETVSVYRRLIDEHRAATDDEISRLSAAFSRSGFSDGYYTGRIGRGMFGVRTEGDKAASRSVVTEIKERKLPVSISAEFKAGKPAYICASARGITAEAQGDVPFEALNRPFDTDELKKRLCKTGGTCFSVVGCDVVADAGVMLPMGAINSLRRAVLEKLRRKIIESGVPRRPADGAKIAVDGRAATFKGKPRLVARFEGQPPSAEVLNEALTVCGRVDLPLWYKIPESADSSKISLVLPRAVFDGDTPCVAGLIKEARRAGITQLTVPNIGMLPLCAGFTLHGDYTLNVANALTARTLSGLGFDSLTVSPEVRPDSIVRRYDKAEYLVYGRAPLMHTENCIISNVSGCKKQAGCFAALKDKTGASFPVMREYGHRNTVYNSVLTYLLDKTDALSGVFAFVLMFTDESESEMLRILRSAESGASFDAPYTRAAYRKSKEVF